MPALLLCLATALLSACSHRVTRADAFYEKGMNYKEGKGVERSSLKSEKYLQRSVALYKKAALRGNAEAQYKLAECYNKGTGVSRLPNEAVKWYTEAANQGHAEAQYELAKCYKYGFGINHSYVDAVKWFHKAAEQGHIYAQNELGICYVNGQGVEQSYAEAAKWLRKAAVQGHANAQCNLGVCYAKGLGVEQSMTEAAKWWKLAAEQGHQKAKEFLAKISEKKNIKPLINLTRHDEDQFNFMDAEQDALFHSVGCVGAQRLSLAKESQFGNDSRE